MFKNYLIVAFRSLWRNRTSSLLNIAGLVIALTCCIFIALFIFDELNYDRYHENSKNIYRIQQKTASMGYGPSTSWLLAGTLADEFPEVKTASRIQEMNIEQVYIRSSDQFVQEENFIFADNALFEIFTLPLSIGKPTDALAKPNTVVISKNMAQKYFGGQNPIGQVLDANIRSQWYDLQVTGVLDEIPSNSNFDVDFVFSWSILYEIYDRPGRQVTESHPMETWGMISTFTYVLLEPAGDPDDLTLKLNGYFQNSLPNTYVDGIKLEPFTDIHLYQTATDGGRTAGAIHQIYLFAAIALLILLVAGINHVVLSTATGTRRAKEIGVRKVVGADRKDLVGQFISESVLLAFFSLLLALMVVALFLPWANTLLDKTLDTNYFPLWQLVAALISITLVMGLASGAYVALHLSAMHPIATMKQKVLSGYHHNYFRKTLIIIQFAVFIILMASSLTIYQQLHYIQNTQLGFDEERLIAVDLRSANFGQHYSAFKTEVLKNPNIINVSAGLTLPLLRTGAMFRDATVVGNPDQPVRYFASYVDYDFFETLNTPVADGRIFSADYASDLSESVVLNQMAVNRLGLDHPVGSIIELQDGPVRVIGIVDDWLVSFYREAMPLVYYLRPGDPLIGSMVVRIGPGQMNETLDYLAGVWNQYAPDAIFSFQFIDDALNQQYAADQRLGVLIAIFSGLSIAIASLGLFGLALFMIKGRTKEFGVRKVLGASVTGLIYMQSREMVVLVLIGNIIAWPVAYYAMNKWLQNFAYHADMSWWIFVLAGLSALIIALLTVSYQAVKAATTNPVESLRYE